MEKLNALGLTDKQMKAIITRVVRRVNKQQKQIVDWYRKQKETKNGANS